MTHFWGRPSGGSGRGCVKFEDLFPAGLWVHKDLDPKHTPATHPWSGSSLPVWEHWEGETCVQGCKRPLPGKSWEALHGAGLSPAPGEEQHLHGWHEPTCAESPTATAYVVPLLHGWARGACSGLSGIQPAAEAVSQLSPPPASLSKIGSREAET